MAGNESRNPTEVLAGLALGGFILLAACVSVVIVGLQSGWPVSTALLSMDDGLVELASAVIPKIGRYREFMQQNGYVENVQLMESTLAVSWLVFAALCVVSVPLVRRCVPYVRSLIHFDPRNRGKFRKAGVALAALAVLLLVNEIVGFGFASTSRFNLAKIHLNGWYALFPPLRLMSAHLGFFFGVILLIAASDKAVPQS